MENLSIKLPAIDKSYYSNEDSEKIKKYISDNYNKIKSDIDYISKITNIPIQILKTVIFIESSFSTGKISPAGAVGIMQIKPQTANDVIFLENKKNRLSPEEKKIIIDTIGNERFNGIIKMKYLGHKIKENNYNANVIKNSNLMNIRFNLLCGALLLGILINECTRPDKSVDIDSVFLRYNKGYFFKSKGATILERINKLNKNSEAYRYILKTVGINGILTKQVS